MSPPDSVKILTVGSAVGNIKELFVKIKSIDIKHGPFDFVLCTGDFFGTLKEPEEETDQDQVTQLLNGTITAPLRCYVMQGEHPLPAKIIDQFAKTGGELAKDVFLFNKSGIITTPSGLRIACLGGVFDPDTFSSSEVALGFNSPHFTSQTIDRLLSNTLIKSTQKVHTKNYTSLAAIQASASTSQLIDVLISNTWPSSIADASSSIHPILSSLPPSTFAPILDEVTRKTRPRYHLVSSTKFWEREPYVWTDEGQKRTSRFISLGNFGGINSNNGEKKQRWFYAFSITPNVDPAPPANAVKNPFTEISRPPKRLVPDTGENYIWGDVGHITKRNRTDVPNGDGKPPQGYKCRRCDKGDHFISDCPDRSKPPDGYICKICSISGHLVRDCPTRDAVGDTGGKKPKEGYVCRGCGSDAHYLDDCPVARGREGGGGTERNRGRRGPVKEITSDECWFCLSNPNLAKQLIVSIGTECYVTLPKGQIVPTHPPSSSSAIPGGGHVLIVPISHHPTLSTIPGSLSASILSELESLKKAIRGLYAKYSCAAVFYEVARLSAKGGHAHVQAVPVPNNIANQIESAFLQLNIDFEGDPDEALQTCQGGVQGYFRVELPDGKKMVHILKDHIPFSVQAGRQVMVDVLGMQERIDWKACMLSEEDDRADALAFKSAFQPFDPTL